MIHSSYYTLDEKYKDKIQEYHNEFPVKISSLAKEFNIDIYANAMPEGVSGLIAKDKGKFVIWVQDSDNRLRQRFTAAHELAHYFLHQESFKDGYEIVDNVLYRSKLSDEKEVEANKLAADILMPMEEVNRKLSEKKTTIRELANYFGVSTQAMSIRLGIPI